jgi:hypothetical protein
MVDSARSMSPLIGRSKWNSLPSHRSQDSGLETVAFAQMPSLQPRNRPAGHVVTAANLGKRFLAMIAALDRLAAPCGKAMQVEQRLGHKLGQEP